MNDRSHGKKQNTCSPNSPSLTFTIPSVQGTFLLLSRPSQLSSIYLAGPTASGKSALALALAQTLAGEIVNADAFQLYSGLEICTAQPTVAERALVPHHLYGTLPPTDTCNAGRYATLAQPIITDILARGKVPIITGGSGLYLKALTHGLSPLPSDDAIRAQLAPAPLEEKVAELLRLDPNAAHTVNLRNDRYVTRALEICLITGEPQSRLRTAWDRDQTQPEFTGLCLLWDRDVLNARIDQRVRHMFSDGLIAEVQALPELSGTAEKAIGVPEVSRFLAGDATLEETIAAIQLATRQLAKRQRTWFRRESGFQTLPVSSDHTIDSMLQGALRLVGYMTT